MDTVAIVGTGLIGASFGLALKEAGFAGRILGVSSERSIRAALERGAIDEGAELSSAASRADLIYLSQTISGILETLPKLAAHVRPGCLVTDAGSTKSRIVKAASCLLQGCFLGGHPMAGKEARGAASAEGSLFRWRPYIVTPVSESALEAVKVQEFIEWVKRIGARVVIATPEEHDELIAAASHVPQLLSTALSSALEECADPDRVAAVAGPGLLDMTRLALSSYEIWRDILDTNPEAIEAALKRVEERIANIRSQLRSGEIEAPFETGKRFAARVRAAAPAARESGGDRPIEEREGGARSLPPPRIASKGWTAPRRSRCCEAGSARWRECRGWRSTSSRRG